MYLPSKKLLKLFSLCSAVIVFSVQATTKQCATVEFSPFKIKGTNYITEVVNHNNEYINYLSSFKQIINGMQQYTLSPGWHHFQLYQWQKRSFKAINRRNASSRTTFSMSTKIVPPTIKQIQLYVNANTHYKIKVKSNDSTQTFTFAKSPQNCQVIDKTSLLAAEVMPTSTTTIKLPTNLEYRLRRIMNDIAAQNNVNQKDISAFSPVKYISYFGAAVDKAYAHNGKALKVLAVSPYSFAANLGLVSDDNIIALGKHQIKPNDGTTIGQLNDYLNSLTLGDNIELLVNRNNRKVQLQKPYYPIVIPEVSYQITSSNIAPRQTPSLIADQALPKQLQANLEQLLLELADFYNANHLINKQVEIARSANYDHVYGLLGKVISQQNNYGIKVTYVSSTSPAQAIGLKSGDIIIAVNNQPLLEKSALPFTTTIAQLKNNDSYSFTLKRNDKIRTLVGKYHPMRFSAFKFTINLNSIIRANEGFQQYASTSKTRSRRKVGLFQLSDKRRGYSCQRGVWGNICDGTGINDYTNVSANKRNKLAYPRRTTGTLPVEK